jgi:phage terminase large subunit GpA-like protein
MPSIELIGKDWVSSQIDGITEKIEHITPTAYNEAIRYLPESVTSIPGYIRYSVNPFMREIVDCFDVNSPVREVNLKKGVQITYSTALESGALYFMGHIKTLPIMYMTADKELAAARIENNFLPMLAHSDMGHIIRSSDEGNTRKTGKTAHHLQFEGGGYLVPFGAVNANKMRSYSICVLMKDEIDAWPDRVGKDGDPDKLSDGRCKGYWERRKIFRGSTPLIKGISKIDVQYLRGDQRKYKVLCKWCGFPQELQWSTKDQETKIKGGFKWEFDKYGTLITDSVCYCCSKCGKPHYEHDKEKLFSEEHGAKWVPTARAVSEGIRSYHLPAFYSPIGMQPWYSCVEDYIDCYDPETKKVTDIGKYQVFYNNIRAESFEILGSKVQFIQVSAHRRMEYKYGQVPNAFAMEHMGGPILFLTCTVDVHKQFLAVAVIGWTIDTKSCLIDYFHFEAKNEKDECGSASSSTWGKLREIIEEKEYIADNSVKYKIHTTLIDAGYETDTVTTFCDDYESGVYPILGRDRPAKHSRIKEFDEFTTSTGTLGYKITVDHFKDRLAPVLRREWVKDHEQKKYQFNAPVDITTASLKELCVEIRREKIDDKGIVSYYWYRPGNARNELWDLLIYGHAAVEIIAFSICIKEYELEEIDWDKFWEYMQDQLPEK